MTQPPFRRLFRAGYRVRLVTPTLNGWEGEGLVTKDQEPDEFHVNFRKDDADLDDAGRACCAHFSELELVDQD
jgi:exonuclease III